MKSKVRRKKSKLGGLVSDGTGSPNTSAPSISGAYIRLSQKGKLQRLFHLRKKLTELESDFTNTLESISACNDPNWLDEFARTQKNKGRQFVTALTQHVARLEDRKTKLLVQKNKVLRKIHEITDQVPEAISNSLATPFVNRMLREKIGAPEVGPKTNVPALVRDLTIRKHAHLSNPEICVKLDAELIRREPPPWGFPESWNEKFHVDTYVAAYQHEKCRALVQKLISIAKKRTSPLP
jgi:hypothetical protein